jgi:membrane protein YqaA with SNARE-associated domain
MRKGLVHMLCGAISLVLLIGASIYVAVYIAENAVAKTIIDQFGYVGITIIGYIGGLNLFIPVPGSSFTPIFLAAGVPLIGIIVALSFGSLLADYTAYLIGRLGKTYAKNTGGIWYKRVLQLSLTHKNLIPFFVFAYASLVPLPNEVIIIPLALLGYNFLYLLLPLALGTVIHTTLFSFGVSSLFNMAFINAI